MENMDLKCVLCLLKTSDFISIFEEKGKQLNIASILTQFFWFEVKETDSEVKRICTTCWSHIADFYSFYTKVFEIHRKTWNTSENVESNNFIFPSFKVETAETNDNLYSEEQSSVKNEDGDVKVEIIEFENCIIDSKNSSSSGSDLEQDFAVLDEDVDSSEDEYEKPKSKTRKSKRKGVKDSQLQQKLKTEKQRNARKPNAERIAEEDMQINEFFKMICEICTADLKNFQNLKDHYRTEHNLRGYLSCCNKKIFLRFRAVEHVKFHINPDIFRCQICKKSYANKDCLMKHKRSHCPNQEKLYKCTKCSKEFAKNNLLQQHLVQHIPDEEKLFTCNECGKAYAKESILKTHIKRCHENAYFQICEICGKYLKNRSSMSQHFQEEHSEVKLPKLQCPQCGLCLKKSSYRSHMRSHEDEKRTHICDLCGKQSPNTKALRIHKKRVHFSERTYKCTFCEKAFKRATVLKEHIATHTGNVLYTCPHCPKTFNSGANMHSHRKKMHRNDWEKNRKNRGINTA